MNSKIKEAIRIRTKRAIGGLPLFAIKFSSIYINLVCVLSPFSEDGYIDFEEYFNVMKARMINLDFEKERMITAFKGIICASS